jgi:hypothetical protein
LRLSSVQSGDPQLFVGFGIECAETLIACGSDEHQSAQVVIGPPTFGRPVLAMPLRFEFIHNT